MQTSDMASPLLAPLATLRGASTAAHAGSKRLPNGSLRSRAKKERVKLNLSPANMSLAMRRANRLVKRATPPEKHIKGLLEAMGENFTFQKVFCTTRRFFIVDFYLPRPHKLCLEIDGPSHVRRWRYDD